MLREELEKSDHCVLLVWGDDQGCAWEELFEEFPVKSYLLISTGQHESGSTNTVFSAVQKTIGREPVSRSGVLSGWPCLTAYEVILILDSARSVVGAYTWQPQAKKANAHLSVAPVTDAVGKLVRSFSEIFRLDPLDFPGEDSANKPRSSQESALVISDLGPTLVEMESALREAQLLALVDYHVEMEGTQNRFRREKLQHLGPKVEELLQLRCKSLGRDTASQQSKAYETATREYARFSESFKVARERPSVSELPEDAHEDLKGLYKKGSLLCHPDRVPEEHKVRATELFQQLSAAYREADLEGVREILNRIDKEGFGTSSPRIPFDRVGAMVSLIRLREAIATKVNEVWEIFSSEEWQKVEEYDDWNSYFEEEQRRLDEEIDKIKGTGI